MCFSGWRSMRGAGILRPATSLIRGRFNRGQYGIARSKLPAEQDTRAEGKLAGNVAFSAGGGNPGRAFSTGRHEPALAFPALVPSPLCTNIHPTPPGLNGQAHMPPLAPMVAFDCPRTISRRNANSTSLNASQSAARASSPVAWPERWRSWRVITSM